MRRRTVHLALLVLVVLTASLAGSEAMVRVLLRRDADGQEWLGDLRLRPYHLPLATIGETLARLGDDASFLAYDPDLGWAPRPHAQRADGLGRVDGGGIRRDGETALAPPPGVLRIALFGDSFTFGDEVALDDTWGAALERALAARGVAAEVLNFGVNAYGMDQAYLRWRAGGSAYRPALVVYGFQAEDVLRNLNVFRPLYFMASEVPLSKPRLIVRDGALVTLNVPTIPPERMAATLADLPAHPLAAYERFFAPSFVPHWWLRFRTIALLTATVGNGDPFHLDGEAHELALAIVEAFARDVAATGAAFLIVHLPRHEDLVTLHLGGTLWYEALRRALDERYPSAQPLPALPENDAALFAPHGHYGAALNRMVGEALAEPVLGATRGRR